MGGRQGNGRGFSRLSGMTKSSRVPGCRMHLNPSAGCEQTAFALIFGRSRTAGHHSIQPVITTREAPLINGQWVTPTINYGLRIIISQTLNLHYGTGMKHSASPLPNHFTNCQAQLPALVSTPISYRRTCLVNKSNKSGADLRGDRGNLYALPSPAASIFFPAVLFAVPLSSLAGVQLGLSKRCLPLVENKGARRRPNRTWVSPLFGGHSRLRRPEVSSSAVP